MSAAGRPPRSRPGSSSPIRLTAEVEPIRTDGMQASQHAGTQARKHADTQPEEDRWVNFSTYLPAHLRRELRARCALLDMELRQATAEAITAWLAEHPEP